MAATVVPRANEADAEAMLRCIPADDRDLWVKIGGILKDEFGDTGFPIWDDWSQSSDRYRARDAREVWRSLGRNSTRAGIGTLIYLAREHGWKPGPRVLGTTPKPRSAPSPNADTIAYSARLWLASRVDDSTVGDHPYAVRKGITWAAGAGRGLVDGNIVGRGADCLIVPIRADGTGKVQGVQCINPEGRKQTFGQISRGCLLLGNTLDLDTDWYVAEGWASAVSVVFHHRLGKAVCASAFGKGNMEKTAELLSLRFNPRRIIILREED